MPIFDQLQLASFNGTKFPVQELEVIGGLRDHEHEFPYAPASSPEKLGRKAYTVQMACPFHDTFRKYPNLYPFSLEVLVQAFEDELSADLVIPTIGTFTAYARAWRRRASGRQRSGESVEFLFVEDQSQKYLTTDLTGVTPTHMASTKTKFDAASALASYQSPATPGLLASFDNAVNAVLAIQDTADATTAVMAAKINRVILQAQALDRSPDFQNPVNWPVIGAMHDIWDQSQKLYLNLQSTQVKPLVYVVKVTCSITALSIAIYGDSSHAVDLLNNNAIVNAFAIPAGSRIVYYPATAQAA